VQSQGTHECVLCLWVLRSRKVDKENKTKTHTYVFAHLKSSAHIPSACYSTSNLENHVVDLGLTQYPDFLLNMETKLFNLKECSVKVVINSKFDRLLCEGRTSMSPTIAPFCGSVGEARCSWGTCVVPWGWSKKTRPTPQDPQASDRKCNPTIIVMRFYPRLDAMSDTKLKNSKSAHIIQHWGTHSNQDGAGWQESRRWKRKGSSLGLWPSCPLARSWSCTSAVETLFKIEVFNALQWDLALQNMPLKTTF
jgi:hypothetical protein